MNSSSNRDALRAAAPTAGALSGKERTHLKTVARWILAVCFSLGLLLAWVPLMPVFPRPNLDSAWAYAMNEAVAHRMQFGRDIIFTFGPYASVFTRQYNPATDRLMLIGDALITLAMAAGSVALAERHRLLYLLPVLPVVALLGSHALAGPDALFFLLPLLYLLVCVRATLPASHRQKLAGNRRLTACLALMTLALSLLPLVKASFAVMVAFLGGLGWLLLLRQWPRRAVLLAVVFALGLAGFWLAANQPLGGLARFFNAQRPLISGYSDAMSESGASADLIWYGLTGGLVLIAGCLHFGRIGGISGKVWCMGLTVALYLVFKAAFVRHGHARNAADFVLLVSIYLATSSPLRMVAPIVACALIAWVASAEHYSGLKIQKLIGSLNGYPTFVHLPDVMRERFSGGHHLQERFEAARQVIRQDTPVPHVEGSTDVYPYRQDVLLANGLEWAPRPVVQSYAVYDPTLAQLNANHLLGPSTPRHVFFSVLPIDGRLATLEDGASWPLLLTRYRVVGCTAQVLVLEQKLAPACTPLEMKDVSTSRQRLGRPFLLPESGGPVWADIDVRPTFLGRIVAALFKPPKLHIVFRYGDGSTEAFRYVAAMGRSGFIVSPVIHGTSDFAALLMPRRERYFSSAHPSSVAITGDTGTHLFWEQSFQVHFQSIELPVQPELDKLVYDQWITHPIFHQPVVGPAECCIDAINGKAIAPQPVRVRGPLLVQGWLAVSGEKGIVADNVFVAILGQDGSVRIARARAVSRPDVNAYFKHPEMGDVGFEALLETTDFTGTCTLKIYAGWHGQLFSAPLAIEINDLSRR